MTLPGTIVAVVGSDPKAGSSMIAKSVGELLAKETGEAVLYLKKGPGSVVISP
jgi:Flp pilus assembly CpaE family ATPase